MSIYEAEVAMNKFHSLTYIFVLYGLLKFQHELCRPNIICNLERLTQNNTA